jgi:stage V sporulation protein B
MEQSQSNKFIKGTFILAVAGALVKVMGALYRIPLYRILDDHGIGLFQAAYPIYNMMLSISTAGVPVAVSKLVAEKLAKDNYQGARQVFRVSLWLMLATGLTATGVLLLGANRYATDFLKAPGTYYSLVVIAPSILFFAVKSTFRGFFQGQQTMIPTAISQIVEQLIRVITIFALASILVRQSVEMGAAGAAAGTVTGALVALLLLIVIYGYKLPAYRKRESLASHNTLLPTGKVIKEIFFLALPITIGSLILPLVNVVDATMIIPRLQSGGFLEEEAIRMFGNLTGAAMPLVGFPSLFTLALGTALVPAISNAYATGRKTQVRALTNLSTRLGLMLGLPAAFGMFLLAKPISIALFNNRAVADVLAMASFAIIFLTINQTTSPVLQGLGKTYLPVAHNFVGIFVKAGLTFTLTAIPSINILGPVIGTIVNFLLVSILNIRAIVRLVGWGGSTWSTFGKPLMNSLYMAVAVALTSRFAQGFLLFQSEQWQAAFVVAIAIIVGVGVYGLATLYTGTITRRELEMIPRLGPKLTEILARLKILR